MTRADLTEFAARLDSPRIPDHGRVYAEYRGADDRRTHASLVAFPDGTVAATSCPQMAASLVKARTRI